MTDLLFWTKDRVETARQLGLAIERGQVDVVQRLCKTNPWLVRDHQWNDETTWVGLAAETGNKDMLSALLGLGFNINALSLPEKSSVLFYAISSKYWDLIPFLLMHGANPNLDRPLITAINIKDKTVRLNVVKLLVEHGAEVNRKYELYDDPDNLVTALDWAQDDEVIADYLRSNGAKTLDELNAKKATKGRVATTKFDTEVVEFFRRAFGPVSKKAEIEVVQSGTAISIHTIKPNPMHQNVILFSTGLSERPMSAPKGQESYAHAELFIELPKGWEYEQTSDAQWNWPSRWMRKIAQYPEQHSTWLGGPVTFLANDDPPKPLSEGVPFTTWMLIAEKSFRRADLTEIQLFRMVPIYSAERDFERKHGLAALMRVFDRKKLPFAVDIKRPCLVNG